MASVHRAGAGWRVAWRIEIDGRRRQRNRVFADRREAEDFARHCERAYEARGVAAANDDPTFADFADRFLAWCDDKLQATTVATYRLDLSRARRHLAGVRLSRITPEMLDNAYSALLKDGRDGGGPLHRRTVLRCHRVVHKALAQAVKWRLLPDNPARLATPPSVPPVRVHAPTVEQVGRLLEIARPDPWPVMLALAVTTGLRRGELLGLRLRDLDLDGGWLTVEQVCEQFGRTYRLRLLPKTKTSQRRISLPNDVCELLRVWSGRLKEQVLALGTRWSSDALAFPDLRDGDVCAPRDPAAVSAHAGTLARRAGWPAGIAPLHGLRHRHASSLMHLPVRMVADRLGHSTSRITVDLYQHGDDITARAAGAAAASAFGNVVKLAHRK